MNTEEATAFVIRELGKLRPRNDIVQKLCEAAGMDWTQAEKFVRIVESKNRGAIARKQSPVVVVLGALTMIAGLALSIWVVYETLHGIIIFFLSFPVPYLGNITYFIVGIGMVTGGLRGIWETLVHVWNS